MSKTKKDVIVVLVHGAWADGSSWNKVTQELQRHDFHVVAAQIPLTSFSDDVAVLRKVLLRQAGPVVLAGHSYGRAVITAAATGNPNVKALVTSRRLYRMKVKPWAMCSIACRPTRVPRNCSPTRMGSFG